MGLEGRVAVVTGGGQGIGRGIALRLAQEGCDVAIFDINLQTAEAVAQEVREMGRRALALRVDVASLEEVEEAVKRVVEDLGRLDILVNNAGISVNERFVEQSPEEWRRIIAVNYEGTLYCTRAALEHMIRQNWGRVISISSDAARVGTPREAVYAGAKAAALGFSRSLAAEVARYRVTVNCICPASTDTPLLREHLTEEQIQNRIRANPMGRLGTPEDIANAVAFFAREESDYITGQVLSVNGGIVRVGG